jgi:hypothetical protein
MIWNQRDLEERRDCCKSTTYLPALRVSAAEQVEVMSDGGDMVGESQLFRSTRRDLEDAREMRSRRTA